MADRKLSDALEHEVRAIRKLQSERRNASRARPTARSVRIDNHFHCLLDLLKPRIVWLTRRYGLAHMRADAEQACAIGIYRAVQDWQPAKAAFATLAHWQMRGELQSLRHRVMLDQRQSARSAGVHTVSWFTADGRERTDLAARADEAALPAAERGASDAMARGLLERLLDGIASPSNERALVKTHLFGEPDRGRIDRKERERQRQILRRTLRNCAKMA